MFTVAPRFNSNGEKCLTPGPGAYNPKDWTGPTHVVPAEPTVRRATSILPRPSLSSVPAVRQKQLEKMIDVLEEQLRVKDLELLNVDSQLARQAEQAKQEVQAAAERASFGAAQQMRLLETQEADKKQILELSETRVELQRRVDEREALAQRLRADLADLHHTMAALRDELAMCVDEKAKLGDKLRLALQEAGEQLDRVRREARAHSLALQQQLAEGGRARLALEQENAAAQSSADSLSQDVARLESEVQVWRAKATEREEHIQQLKLAATEKHREWSLNRETLSAEHEVALGKLKGAISELEAELEAERRQKSAALEEAREGLHQLEAEVEQKRLQGETQARALGREVELAVLAREQLEAEKLALEKHARELTARLHSLHKDLAATTEQLHDSASQVEGLSARAAQAEVAWKARLERANQASAADVHQLRTQHAEAVAGMEALHARERSEGQKRVRELAGKVAQVSEELEAARVRAGEAIAALEAQIEGARAGKTQAEQHALGLQSSLHQSRLELAALRREAAECAELERQRQAQWEAALEQARAEHAAQLAAADQGCAELLRTVESLRHEAEEVKSELARVHSEAERQVARLQAEAAASEVAKQALEAEKVAVEERCAALQAQLHASRTETQEWNAKAQEAEQRARGGVASAVEQERVWGAKLAEAERAHEERISEIEANLECELQLERDKARGEVEQACTHSEQARREWEAKVAELEAEAETVRAAREQDLKKEGELRRKAVEEAEARRCEQVAELEREMRGQAERHRVLVTSLQCEHENEVSVLQLQLVAERTEAKHALGRVHVTMGELSGQLAVGKADLEKVTANCELQLTERAAQCERLAREVEALQRQVGEAQQLGKAWASKAVEAQRELSDMLPQALQREQLHQRESHQAALRHQALLQELQELQAKQQKLAQELSSSHAAREQAELSLQQLKRETDSQLSILQHQLATATAQADQADQAREAQARKLEVAAARHCEQLRLAAEEKAEELRAFSANFAEEEAAWKRETQVLQAKHEAEVEQLAREHGLEVGALQQRLESERGEWTERVENARLLGEELTQEARLRLSEFKEQHRQMVKQLEDRAEVARKNAEEKIKELRTQMERARREGDSFVNSVQSSAEKAIKQLEAKVQLLEKEKEILERESKSLRGKQAETGKAAKERAEELERQVKESKRELSESVAYCSRQDKAIKALEREKKVLELGASKAEEGKAGRARQRVHEEARRAAETALLEERNAHAAAVQLLQRQLADSQQLLSTAMATAAKEVEAVRSTAVEAEVELETLKARLAHSQEELKLALEEVAKADEARAQLAGHVNHRQKIHLHEKIKEENSLLKQENLRVRTELKSLFQELKCRDAASASASASASSTVPATPSRKTCNSGVEHQPASAEDKENHNRNESAAGGSTATQAGNLNNNNNNSNSNSNSSSSSSSSVAAGAGAVLGKLKSLIQDSDSAVAALPQLLTPRKQAPIATGNGRVVVMTPGGGVIPLHEKRKQLALAVAGAASKEAKLNPR